ncbi:uncharacterized protein LOC130893425 [Diorhabda carinulata]|uniref:uncharacterized protein LOC130445477 n=1 Tax=Diorhabda sublineata TaxID=1163346 RepID=UPI0024E185EF|nr:uncharacterized protein LOC130445477 [Diorhabda sublineata]XP_057655507.1 uncharacterized protein LOC130893425 [Diorhabda carinulata]
MYAKIALAALLVCALYSRAYGNLVSCEDPDEPGLLVSKIYEEPPKKSNFTLRAPEYGETETAISCIFFDSSENFNVVITDGGLGKNFVELQISPIDEVEDDHHHHDDRDDKYYYELNVYRKPN